MYNNSRLAFFRALNDNTNKIEAYPNSNLNGNMKEQSSAMSSNVKVEDFHGMSSNVKVEDFHGMSSNVKVEDFHGTLISSLNTSNNNHKQLLDAYNNALKNVVETKKKLDAFLASMPNTVNNTVTPISEQVSYQSENKIIEKIAPQLLYCDWGKIKLDPNNIENIVSLINVDEMIYPYLEKLINLKTISLSDGFNATINLSELDKLEDITFGANFNQVVSKDNLPKNLKKLKLGLNFLRKIEDLPISINELILDNRFNSTIILPPNLISLTVGDSFNQDIILNDNLESITFGYHFNKSLILSKSLKKLSLSGKFNQDIELNDTLEELTLGQTFNKNLKLPNSVKVLTLKNRAILPKIILNKNVKINL